MLSGARKRDYVASCVCSDIQFQVRQRGHSFRIVPVASELTGSRRGKLNAGTSTVVPQRGQETESRCIEVPSSLLQVAAQ